MSAQQKALKGLLAEAITPRRAGEHSIDLAASLELVDFLGNSGADGIVLLGSVGEFVHFMLEDRSRMLDFAVKRSRLPVLANVSHSTLDGALQLAHDAAESGVAGVLIMPPYFYEYDQETIRTFLLRFAEGVAIETAIYLHNDPNHTHALFPETAASLIASGLFAGIVDSSGEPAYFAHIGDGSPATVNFLAGSDALLPNWKGAGETGVISATACAIPELLVDLVRAVESNDSGRESHCAELLAEFTAWFARAPKLAILKETCRLRKLKSGDPAVPLSAEAGAAIEDFRAWFPAWWSGQQAR